MKNKCCQKQAFLWYLSISLSQKLPVTEAHSSSENLLGVPGGCTQMQTLVSLFRDRNMQEDTETEYQTNWKKQEGNSRNRQGVRGSEGFMLHSS